MMLLVGVSCFILSLVLLIVFVISFILDDKNIKRFSYLLMGISSFVLLMGVTEHSTGAYTSEYSMEKQTFSEGEIWNDRVMKSSDTIYSIISTNTRGLRPLDGDFIEDRVSDRHTVKSFMNTIPDIPESDTTWVYGMSARAKFLETPGRWIPWFILGVILCAITYGRWVSYMFILYKRLKISESRSIASSNLFVMGDYECAVKSESLQFWNYKAMLNIKNEHLSKKDKLNKVT